MRRLTTILAGILLVLGAGAALALEDPPVKVWERGGWGGAPGQLRHPQKLSFDLDGNLLVPEWNHRISYFDGDGNFLRSFGSFGDAEGYLHMPEAAAVGADGTIYVVDAGNARISVFDSGGDFIRVWGQPGSGPGAVGYAHSVVVDDSGHVHVARDGVKEFLGDGTYVRTWCLQGFGVVYDSHGQCFWVLESDGVRKYNRQLQPVLYWPFPPEDEGVPSAIAVGPDGTLYVTTYYHDLVTHYATDGEILGWWGVSRPSGVAVDEQGNVYVADGFALVYGSGVHTISKWVYGAPTPALQTTWGRI